jgi:leader peptidase (prepilin peptidase)/N-methyltransferase
VSTSTFVALACGLMGLAVGSFLNVVIWRVPREESVVAPRSKCPSCGTPIAPIDNVPVVSWIALRGKCRHCGEPINVRYPLVELACCALFAGVGARFGASWALPAYLVFSAALLALSAIDLEHYRLPNRIVYPLAIALPALLVIPAAVDGEFDILGRAMLGGLVAFAGLFTLHLISPRGMGLGDVKLAFPLGVALGWLGWGHLAFGLLLGFLYGSVLAIALVVLRLRSRRDALPFGPFLAAGAMTMVFWGRPIVDWYLARRGI